MKFNLGERVKIKSNGVIGIIISRGYNEYLDENDKQQSFEEYQIEADKYYQCNEDEIELYNPIIEEGKYLTKDIIDCKMFEELMGLLKPQEIKNVKVKGNNPVNPFMEEYEKIVNEIVRLCKRKNADYGSSVQDTYEKFGDISYLTRITDKYNRICSLMTKENKVKDESIIDSIKDMGNYCFLWATSKSLEEKESK